MGKNKCPPFVPPAVLLSNPIPMEVSQDNISANPVQLTKANLTIDSNTTVTDTNPADSVRFLQELTPIRIQHPNDPKQISTFKKGNIQEISDRHGIKVDFVGDSPLVDQIIPEVVASIGQLANDVTKLHQRIVTIERSANTANSGNPKFTS